MEYKEPDPNIDHLSGMQKIGLYPVLPTAPEIQSANTKGSAHSYRLQIIKEMQKQIEQEREKRSTLSKNITEACKLLTFLIISWWAPQWGLVSQE